MAIGNTIPTNRNFGTGNLNSLAIDRINEKYATGFYCNQSTSLLGEPQHILDPKAQDSYLKECADAHHTQNDELRRAAQSGKFLPK